MSHNHMTVTIGAEDSKLSLFYFLSYFYFIFRIRVSMILYVIVIHQVIYITVTVIQSHDT